MSARTWYKFFFVKLHWNIQNECRFMRVKLYSDSSADNWLYYLFVRAKMLLKITVKAVNWWRAIDCDRSNGVASTGAGAVGERLDLMNVSRQCADVYECTANNNVPPAASHLVKLTVECTLILRLHNHITLCCAASRSTDLARPSVCLSVSYGLLTRKQINVERKNIGANVLRD